MCTGIIIGVNIETIIVYIDSTRKRVLKKTQEKNPFMGKNGLLSYRNARLRLEEEEDDD